MEGMVVLVYAHSINWPNVHLSLYKYLYLFPVTLCTLFKQQLQVCHSLHNYFMLQWEVSVCVVITISVCSLLLPSPTDVGHLQPTASLCCRRWRCLSMHWRACTGMTWPKSLAQEPQLLGDGWTGGTALCGALSWCSHCVCIHLSTARMWVE